MKMTSKNPKTRISAIEARYGSCLSDYRLSSGLYKFNLSSRYTRRESLLENKENRNENISTNISSSRFIRKGLEKRRNSNFVSVLGQLKLNQGSRTSRARPIGRTSVYQSILSTDRSSGSLARFMRR